MFKPHPSLTSFCMSAVLCACIVGINISLTGCVDKRAAAIEKFNRKYDVQTAKQLDVLWVGDSITEYWQQEGAEVWAKQFADKKCKNLGIAGDTTQDVLRRLTLSDLDGVNAKVTVVLIGTNNFSIGSETDESIALQIQQIVELIHKRIPTTQIVLMGVFPRFWSPEAQIRERVASINKLLAKLDNGTYVHFLDIGDKFLEPNGEIAADVMPDALHLSSKGYGIWADNVKPVIDKLLQSSEHQIANTKQSNSTK